MITASLERGLSNQRARQVPSTIRDRRKHPLHRFTLFKLQAWNFAGRLSHALSKKMVRRVTDRWGHQIWPWERGSTLNAQTHLL